MVNKKYLCAALTFGLSTAGGPLAMAYTVEERSIPYFVGSAYFLLCSYVGVAEVCQERKNKLNICDRRKFCNGMERLTIEELVSSGNLSLDE